MSTTPEPALADDLTGALNRRYLRELFERKWESLLAQFGRVALLVIDLDAFKPINDRFGHLVGDAVLRAVAVRLRTAFRDGDRLVRYGGDEFVVVLPGAGAEEARALAERARVALAEAPWLDPKTGVPLEHRVSFSIGAAAAPEDGATGDQVLAAADQRLYAEKQVRRNRGRARRRRRRWPQLALAASALIALAFAAARWAQPRPPAVPDVGVAAPLPAAVPPPAAEIEALRAEVARLEAALAAERSQPLREDYERRIRALETTLAAAERAAAPTPSELIALETPAAEASLSAAPVPEPVALPPGTRLDDAAIEAIGPVAEAAAPGPSIAIESIPRLEPPQLLRHDPPVYPLVALQRRIEAAIDLRLAIDEQGSVVAVEQTSPFAGYGLDEAARRAASSARYRPGRRAGTAVPSSATLQIRFVLERERGR